MNITPLYKRLSRGREERDQDSDVKGNADSVYNALISALNGMDKNCVGRIILTLYEDKPDNGVNGRWINPEETIYYPFETLTQDEKRMWQGGKTYRVIALVTEGNGNPVSYNGNGIEMYLRTHINPLLSQLVPESQLRYVTKGGAYTNEQNIRELARSGSESGWTEESIQTAFNYGMHQYKEVTKRLMKEAGDYKSLQRMDQRNKSSLEEILSSIRERISKAK